MPLRESEAIVLRTYPLGEGDRLVSFLDRQSGRLRGVARGARLPKSRFGSTLELLSYIRIWYFERETRELVRVNQCELLESFLDLQRDYPSAVALALISEITELALAERETSDAQFRLILLTSRAIRSVGPLPAVMAYFALWTARIGGWLGPFDRCSRCGREMLQEAAFHSHGQADLVCENCKEDWNERLSKESLVIGRMALSGTLDRLLKQNPAIDPSKEILGCTLDILEKHFEKKLTSRKILETGEAGSFEI